MTGLKSTNNLPALQQLRLLRKDEITMDIFCNNFLSCVIGKHYWKRQKKHKLIRELATVSDEAFALLVLENIWDEWKDMNVVEFFSRRKGMEKGTKRRKIGGGRWTSDANGGTKYGGWNVDGIKRFNELCQHVKTNRTSYPAFDHEFSTKSPTNVTKRLPQNI